MGPDEVPASGIDLDGQTYVVVTTDHSADRSTDRSVLTKFTPPATFTPGRTISRGPDGRFVKMSLQVMVHPIRGLSAGGPFVLMWGTGRYRQSDAYLAVVPTASFESGQGTRYFAGTDASGAPKWSASESDAKAIVTNGTMGDLSVTWSKDLQLWLMTYDSRPPATAGILFSYSPTPWGPWSDPQVIFDAVRDGAFGKFIHDPKAKPNDGLAGPVIGQGKDNPDAVRGGEYAPYVVERWTKVQDGELDLYYVLSTWNPYVVMLMKSRLTVGSSGSPGTPRVEPTVRPGPPGTPKVEPTVRPGPPRAEGAAVPASFFAMNTVNVKDYPKLNFGTLSHPQIGSWPAIERSKGTYDFSLLDQYVHEAVAHGLVDRDNTVSLAVTLGFTPPWAAKDPASCKGEHCTSGPANLRDWTNYVTAVLKHYDGVTMPHIRWYEVWNEVDIRLFYTGTMPEMISLAQAAYPIVHADPHSMLLTPSVVGADAPTYMARYLDLGGARYADGGAFHGYLVAKGVKPFPMPEQNPSDCAAPGVCYGSILSIVNGMRQVFDQHGLAGKPMFQTEGSWGDGSVTEPPTQAAWLARWYLLQAGLRAADNLQMSAWFTWGDPKTFHWGTIETDAGEPSEAGVAFDQVVAWVVGAEMPAPCASTPDGTWACALTRPGGYRALAVWNTHGSIAYRPGPGYTDYRDLTGATSAIAPGAPVPIGARPILLESSPVAAVAADH